MKKGTIEAPYNNYLNVPSLGIEPRLQDPQSCVLSIKLQGQDRRIIL